MKRTRFFFLLIAFLIIAGTPAQSQNIRTEVARLQSDVLAMQKQIMEIEKIFTERMDGLRSLVAQLNDQAAESNIILNRVAWAMEEQESGRPSERALGDEVRRLSERIDEFSTRISAMAQQLNEMRTQYRPLSQAGALGPDAMYNQAFSDFVQGNFDLAIQGFTSYVEIYPNDGRVPSALLNLGDSYSNQNMLPQAIAAYTRIINDHGGSDRVSSALFKRARAELAMQRRDNAIADFRTIVDKHPASPEFDLATTELQKLGVSLPKRR